MSSVSNDQGRAYEFAWMNALYNEISKVRSVKIINNSSLSANESAWNKMSEEIQDVFRISAEAAIKTVIELEPNLVENDDNELTLRFQKDGEGIKGDVRDIVVSRTNINWEIGLSIKHNHEAIKHSRLSKKLDFGNEWFGDKCSLDYWNAIKPIFDQLEEAKKESKDWKDLVDKDNTIYVPLLQAFIDEINKKYRADSSISTKMVEYLIGVKDYYKVVSQDSKRLTLIHTFNMHGTLNKPSKIVVSAITVPVVELPTRIIALGFREDSKTTVEMYLNNGWELSFRIHNAGTKVETSLKFDVQFMGMPPTVLTISCSWNR